MLKPVDFAFVFSVGCNRIKLRIKRMKLCLVQREAKIQMSPLTCSLDCLRGEPSASYWETDEGVHAQQHCYIL